MQRSFKYSQLKGLEDERKMMVFQAREDIRKRTIFDSTLEIPGTAPEKKVYNYLRKLKIPFEFQYHMADNPVTLYGEDAWIPDFMIRQFNIIIEVFGSYWHSMKRRRDADQLKKAYWLAMGYTIVENGIPEYPSGGTAIGKAVIWWEWEINLGVDHLLARDLPELLVNQRAIGQPEAFLLDAEYERLAKIAKVKSSVKRRIRPKIDPIYRKMRKLRRQLFDFNKTYPLNGKYK